MVHKCNIFNKKNSTREMEIRISRHTKRSYLTNTGKYNPCINNGQKYTTIARFQT